MAKPSKKLAKDKVRADIAKLFSLAETAEPDLARSYVRKARKLSERLRISLRKYNRVHCRKCDTYWARGMSRVRNTPTSVVIRCLHCGTMKRIRK